MIYSIRHPEYFEVHCGHDEESLYGCDQEWYNSEWQRLSGCGPSMKIDLGLWYNTTELGGGFVYFGIRSY